MFDLVDEAFNEVSFTVQVLVVLKTRMRVICTFVPPLAGGKIHDADGSYSA